MRVIISLACLCLATTSAVQAQTIIMNNGGTTNLSRASDERRKTSVTVNIQLSLPAIAHDNVPDLTASLSLGNKAVFDIVDHECDVLSKSLNGTCRVIQVNNNSNVGRPGQSGSSVSASASATFEIDLSLPAASLSAAPPPSASH